MATEIFDYNGILNEYLPDLELPLTVVTPGESLASEENFMKGYNCHVDNGLIVSLVAGTVERVNRLICVKTVKNCYLPEIGDIIVGRIIKMSQRRWFVDTGSHVNSVLLLASVNLPGGELRRRNEDDEQKMKNYLKDGDVVAAEVQSVFSDGSASLHTRNLNYGKLPPGRLLKIPNNLCKKCKTRIHKLEKYGTMVIISANGWIWVGSSMFYSTDLSQYSQNIPKILLSTNDHLNISRICNCILLISQFNLSLNINLLNLVIELSLNNQVEDLLDGKFSKQIIIDAIKNHSTANSAN